jgi:hypothetical protein
MTTPFWDDWKFLLGEWVGEGGGAPGQGGGNLTFQFDLQDQVLLRRNHVDFPATPERPAFAHDDLTVIYPDPAGSMRAIYFDNEAHVIHYTAAFTGDGNTVTFVSDPILSAPRFRTTYIKGQDRTMTIRFEIAPPGNPDGFSVYTEGTAKVK